MEAEQEVQIEEPEVEVETHEGFVSIEDNQQQVNKQHRKYRDAERTATKAQADNDRLQKELDEFKASSVDLTVPPAPDPYADDYAEQVIKRDEKIQQIADHKAEARSLETAQQQQQTEAKTDQERKDAEALQTFDANFLKLGLKPDEMKQAAQTVIENGISETLEDILLLDEDGPLLVKYFADNPVEQDNLSGMSPFQLLNHLNSEIKPKASLLKPKTSQAPEPPMTLQGGGVAELQEPWEKGVKYE